MKDDHTPAPSELLGVLVLAPPPKELEFYAKWFHAIHRAEELWKRAYADPEFEARVDRLFIGYDLNFEFTGAEIFRRLKPTLPGLALWLGEAECVDEFVLMAQLGFFKPDGEHYCIAIPEHVTFEQVQAAALRYAETEDEKHFLHPETILQTLLIGDARRALQTMRPMLAAHVCAETVIANVVDLDAFRVAKAKVIQCPG
jgi:hypothetical protein